MNGHPAEGSRDALLELHFAEAEEEAAARTRAHAEACAECRAYLASLGRLEEALHGWADEAAPAGLREASLARAAAVRQVVPRAAAPPSAAPLLGLLPLMAAGLGLVWLVGSRFAASSPWQAVEELLGVPPAAAFAAAALVLVLAGGVASLAVAPALVLESRRSARGAQTEGLR
jgi:hypothetical protein